MIIIEENNLVMYSPITTDFPKTECWNTSEKIYWKTISLHLIVTFYFFIK